MKLNIVKAISITVGVAIVGYLLLLCIYYFIAPKAVDTDLNKITSSAKAEVTKKFQDTTNFTEDTQLHTEESPVIDTAAVISQTQENTDETTIVSEINSNIKKDVNFQNTTTAPITNFYVKETKLKKTTTQTTTTLFTTLFTTIRPPITTALPTSTTTTPTQTTSPPQTTTTPPQMTQAPVTTQPQPPLPQQPTAKNGEYLVGYYAGWSAYSGFTPKNVDSSKLTHINYAFAKIDGINLTIALGDPTNDKKNFTELRALKQSNPKLRTLISIGGWDYSKYFSDVALTAASREKFAQSCLDLILLYGFDGVDLDWEYPVSGGLAGNIHRASDKQNYTLLLQSIRDKFNQQSAADGRKYVLSIAAAPSSYFTTNVEITKIASIVDYIFLMGYDLHGSWDTYSDFNAPLYSVPGSPQYSGSISQGVNHYLNKGVPNSKLVLGMPFYGYLYNVTSTVNNGLFSKFTSAKSVGYDHVVANYLSKPVYQKFYHPTASVPYLFGNNIFISFENAQSISEKTKFAVSNGLAGVGAWELSFDRNSILLTSAYNNLN